MHLARAAGGVCDRGKARVAPLIYTVVLSERTAHLIRLSFRQSMLAGFMLIALLLSWAAVRSWLVLEQFVVDSRQGSEQALQLTTSIQELAERSVDLERSARQFVILKDAALLARFDENVAHSLAAANRLESVAGESLGQLPGSWRAALQELSLALHQRAPRSDLQPFLTRLAELNTALEHSGRQWIAAQQASMLSGLERNREQLARLVALAVAGAFLVALAMNWWLSRPIKMLDDAIARLGESHFDEAVIVGGPTDLREIGRRLDWLRRRLGELEAERERALRHVSHELKTPLTALREGIALLRDEVAGALAGAQGEVVDILQHNVMTLQGHIESLLRLNAAAFEARRLHYGPLSLRQLLADLVQAHDLQIQARRLTVQCAAPAASCVVDAEKLRVAIDNLLSNAIDFSPHAATIGLIAEIVGKTLRVACIDQGPGVAAEDAERIFEPFVQGPRPAPMPRQGSGVGLSIVRELVTAMGGRVWLATGARDARGANFVIEIPCEA